MRMCWRVLPTVLLAVCAMLASSISGVFGSRAPVSGSLSSLVTRPLPPRNLYALTDQLKLRPPRPIRHVIRKTTPNYPVGRTDRFYVLAEDTNKYFTMKATLMGKSPHLYIYVQNGVKVDKAATQSAANYFERYIYPTDRASFGSEWIPGVDHDPHITCLVGDLHSSSAAGFYSAEDEYPRVVHRWSNEREMIYLNSSSTLPGDRSFKTIMSHEFQHMIHWNMHPRDNAWLNEGMSMLAEYLNHFPPNGEASAFLQSPTTQLNTWSLSDASTIPHYGGAYLFLHYLYEQYGRGVIKDMLADRADTDFELVDHVLHQHHINRSARQVFTDWVIANWLNDRSLANGRYGYKDMSDHVSITDTRPTTFSSHWSIPPWAAQYLAIDGVGKAKPFRLSFSAPTTVPAVSFSGAANTWWSNRGDMANTRLVRTLDLRKVHHATLRFRTDYNIEKGYDYAYVEASRDGGKTWDTLKTAHTTSANPNGGNFGNGYTGNSKGWITEAADLSPYAGKKIKLRFDYVTDDEYNAQGMVIGDIAVPQIHFHDNGSGWSSAGFVPLGADQLPSRWTVQLIETTDRGASVTALPVTNGKGSIDIDPVRLGLKKLVIVTFTTAPKTTVQSEYTLSASQISG